jgi:hypothetical protein
VPGQSVRQKLRAGNIVTTDTAEQYISLTFLSFPSLAFKRPGGKSILTRFNLLFDIFSQAFRTDQDVLLLIELAAQKNIQKQRQKIQPD